MTSLSPPPTGSGRVMTLVTLGFAVWLHAASSMLAATTVPRAIEEIGGAALLGWAFMLYQLGSIVAGAACAIVVQRMRLRNALALAAVGYAFGCMVCAFAPHFVVLLIGRTLQGAGGGALVALTFVALHRLFTPEQIPRVMALISTVWSVSAFCGPVVGGSFATYSSWRFAFVAFAVQAVAFVVVVRALRLDVAEARHDESVRFPLQRLAMLAIAVLLIGGTGVVLHPVASTLMAIGALWLFYLFVKRDGQSGRARMLPARPWDPRGTLGAGYCLIVLGFISTMSFLVYGPLLLEQLHGVTPLSAGYIVALESIGWGAMAVIVSRCGSVVEPWLIRLGPFVIGGAMVGFAVLMPTGPLAAIVICAIAQGAGFGMMFSFIVKRIVAAAEPEERDVAATAIAAVQQIAMAIGAAVVGIVGNLAGFADGVSQAAAAQAATWVFAAFVPLALPAVLVAMRLAHARGTGSTSRQTRRQAKQPEKY